MATTIAGTRNTPGSMLPSNSLRRSADLVPPPPSSPIQTLNALLQRMKTAPRCCSDVIDESAGIPIGAPVSERFSAPGGADAKTFDVATALEASITFIGFAMPYFFHIASLKPSIVDIP